MNNIILYKRRPIMKDFPIFGRHLQPKVGIRL